MVGLILAGFLCTVTAVHDGDTWSCREGLEVRLWGVAVPEIPWRGRPGEPGGPEAAAWLRERILGRQLACEAKRGSHQRLVARCWLGEADLGRLLVEAGHGRDCPAFSAGLYAAAETQAGRALALHDYCLPPKPRA